MPGLGATAALGGPAGCAGRLLSLDDSGGPPGHAEYSPAPDAPALDGDGSIPGFTRWLPAPDELDGEVERLQYASVDVAGVAGGPFRRW